jgi:hypothetical protein
MVTTEQAVRNSMLIREVNDRITELSNWHDGEARELLCECGDEACIEAILVLRADHEAARELPNCYLVASNHDRKEAVTVVTAREGYSIVQYEATAS